MNVVDDQGNTLLGTQMAFADLMTMVANLRTVNTTNNADLAGQKAVDSKQDDKVDKLDTNITLLE